VTRVSIYFLRRRPRIAKCVGKYNFENLLHGRGTKRLLASLRSQCLPG
jgi:hypothetical protein